MTLTGKPNARYESDGPNAFKHVLRPKHEAAYWSRAEARIKEANKDNRREMV